jgi:hypothetical protein
VTIHAKTAALINEAARVLAAHHPMTVRQVYYQLVSRQVIENNRSQYQAVSKALVRARQNGIIPWEWIEEGLRRPRTVGMWTDLRDFGKTVLQAYRREIWTSQPIYFEVWLEKDALSGIFEEILKPYGVTLNVGRGYDGWDSISNAAGRFGLHDKTTILYFGDWDPSGEDMVRSLGERLGFFDCHPEIVRCAILPEDIQEHDLPPDFAKKIDTRHKKFVDRFGDRAVELDALPGEALRARIKEEVEKRTDLVALDAVRQREASERRFLARILAEVSS